MKGMLGLSDFFLQGIGMSLAIAPVAFPVQRHASDGAALARDCAQVQADFWDVAEHISPEVSDILAQIVAEELARKVAAPVGTQLELAL